MEKWQREHITSNLPELISDTKVDTYLLSCFESKNVLTKEDVERIIKMRVSHDRAHRLYSIIQTQSNGYIHLLEALEKANCSGALKVLLSTAPNLFCQNLVVRIGSKEISFTKLLRKQQLQQFTSWFQKYIKLEIYKGLVRSNDPISLVPDAIPEPDPLYIPRYLSRRNKIDSKIFDEEGKDIFVFKNISRLELRNLVGKNVIKSSTEQLFKIDCRFILLSNVAHWNELRLSASVPIHLVAFHETGNIFVLEQTSGGSDHISQYLQHDTNQTGIIETELTSNERPETEKGLCICDSPGMGKTMLLANLARKTQEKYPDRVVPFIRLSEFAQNLTDKDFGNVKGFLLDWLTNSPLNKYLLQLLLEENLIKMELFFDGLDEVQTDYLDIITKFLVLVLDNMPNCRVYATSRTYLLKELESATRFIAYNILPFDEEQQIQYLVSFWQKKFPETNETRLRKFAQECLKIFRNNVNDKETKLLGIPLQCRIFAEIYSKLARIPGYFDKDPGIQDEQHIVKNVWETYKLFMEDRLARSECSFQCILESHSKSSKQFLGTGCSEACKLKSYHTWTALKTVFPNFANLITHKKSEFQDLTVHKVLGPGIIVKVTDAAVHFLHRSFAEYLFAEFFTSQLLVITNKENGNLWLARMAIKYLFTDLMQTVGSFDLEPLSDIPYTFHMSIKFRHPLVVYFVEKFTDSWGALNSSALEHINRELINCSIRFFEVTCAVLKWDHNKLLHVFLRLWLTPKETVLGEDVSVLQLTSEQKLILMNTAARYSNPSTINILMDLFKELVSIDLMLACDTVDFKTWSPIQIVLRYADYEKVCMFYDKLKPEGRGLIYFLVQYTYEEDKEGLEKRKEICNLLLDKYPFLLAETHEEFSRKYSGPVVTPGISSELIAYLVKERCADIRATTSEKCNVVGFAALYMSKPDFQKLIQFVIQSQNAPDIFISTEKWESPLHTVLWKVKGLELETVQMIFDETGADVNELDEDGYNLVQNAIRYHHSMDIIKFLETKGANLTHRTNEKRNSLHIAVLFDNFDALFYITSLNIIDTEERNKFGLTSILAAARRGHLAMIEHLVELGVNLFAMDNDGNSLLLLYARAGYRGIAIDSFLNWLQRKCEDICPIQQALNDSGEPIVNEHCLSNFFGLPNQKGVTPILVVSKYSTLRPETFAIFFDYSKSRKGKFLKHPVDINAPDQNGVTVLYNCMGKIECTVSFVKMMVEHGLEWNVKDASHCNITHHCVRRGRYELLKYFVSLDSDVNELDAYGNNALQCTFHFKGEDGLNDKTLAVLVESGLNFDNINTKGETASIMYKKSPLFKEGHEKYLELKNYFKI